MSGKRLQYLNRGDIDCQSCKLGDLALFASLTKADFEQIHEPIHDYRFAQHSLIHRQDEQAKHLYTLRSGMLKLEHLQVDGERKIVRLLRVGDVLGLEALVDGRYRHTAVALQPAALCAIPLQTIDRLKHHSPSLCAELMRRWQLALDSADEWLVRLHTGQARQRVIELVSHLAECSGSQRDFVLPTRDDMAAILGLASETVSRVIADLRRNGQLLALGDSSYEWSQNN